MPQQIKWKVGGVAVDINERKLPKSDADALERTLMEANRIMPDVVVVVKEGFSGDTLYAADPGSRGVIHLNFHCGHTYSFSDKDAFFGPACEVCDAELSRRARESPEIWFSKKSEKPKEGVLEKVKKILKVREKEEKSGGEEE